MVKMIDWRCSHCYRKYTTQQFIKLKYTTIKGHEGAGRFPICKCGKAFHIEKWMRRTIRGRYQVSTVDLEIPHGGSYFKDWGDYEFYYETMIYDSKEDNFLPFQMRYKTKEEAERAHNFTVKHLKRIIKDPNKYPQDIITKVFGLETRGLRK